MREIEIAMAMICQVDNYHLQFRDGHRKIGAAGLVGWFGGKINLGEDPRETIARELSEETSLAFHPERFRHIDSISVVSDHNLEPVQIRAQVFEILLPLKPQVDAKEGQLV